MDKYPLHRTGATGYNGTGKGTRYVGSRVFSLPRSKGKEGDVKEAITDTVKPIALKKQKKETKIESKTETATIDK